MCLTIFYNEKTSFFAIKTRSSKRPKIAIFRERLTYGFGAKISIFPTFFFRQYTPGECFLRYLITKKRLFGLLKQEVQKDQKLTIFQRG